MARTELFKRLPEAWKRLDYLYGGVLEKFLGVFDQEYDLRHDQIEDLLDLRTPNKAPDAYIHLLGRLIGYEWDYDKSYAWNRQRVMIAIRRYSYKGTLDAVEDVIIEAGGDEWWVVDMASTVVVPSRQGNLGTDNCYLVAPDYHHAGAYELQVTAAIDEMDVVNNHLDRNTAAGEYWYLKTVPGTIPGDFAIKGGLLTMDSLLDLTKTEIQLYEGTSDNPLSELDAVIQACDENVFILSLGPSCWLDAYQGITLDSNDAVSAWADQSGNDNDVSQGTEANRPKYVFYSTNGLPAIRSESTSQLLAWATNTFLQAEEVTLFSVTDLDPGHSMDYDMLIWGGCNRPLFYNLKAIAGSPSQLTPAWPDQITTPMAACYKYDGTDAHISVNGEPFVSDSYTYTASQYWQNIGAAYGEFFDGPISELIFFDRELSLTEIYGVYSYLGNKFNISIAKAPLFVDNCSLWLDAGQGITTDASGNVSDWEDQSGQNHDLAQTTDTRRPIYNATDSNFGGSPSLNFANNRGMEFPTPWTQALNLTIFVVAKFDSEDTIFSTIIARGSGNGPFINYRDFSGLKYCSLCNFNRQAYSEVITEPAIAGFKITDDPNHYVRVNGGSWNIGATPDDNERGTWKNVGHSNYVSGYFAQDNEIAEILIYDRELSDDEVDFIENYLSSKHNISLPDKPPPLLVPDCSIWLDAGEGITLSGSAVTAWADQSQNNRDLSQTTPADRLTYVTNAVNGKPVLRGTTGTPHMDFDYQVFPQKTDMTLFAVMKSNTPSGQSHTFERSPFVGYYFFGIGGDYLYIANGSHNLQGTTKVNSDYSICRWKLAGTDAEVCVNGGTPNTIDNADLDRSYWNEFGDATYPAMGDFAEFIMYDRKLSTGEISFIENYLSEKYDIELGG